MPKYEECVTGKVVTITCYKIGCEKVSLPVTLGKEHEIHPTFLGSGRMWWKPGTPVKGFNLGMHNEGSGYCNCSNCGTTFGGVVVVKFKTNHNGTKTVAFGYEPEQDD